LYWRLTAEDHIAAGAHVNARFDGESVRTRMRSLGIPLDRAAGRLSGGQRTQLALALTLAKSPACCWMSWWPRWTRWPAASSSLRSPRPW